MGFSKLRVTIILFILFGIISTSFSLASPDEYLFDGEFKNREINIGIDNEVYDIYSISSNQIGNILVINKEGNMDVINNEKEIKEALFSYYTHKYIQENQDGMQNEFQETSNLLYSNSKSIGQKILNIFKNLNEVCTPIPKVEILSICVKPTDKLNIMSVGFLGITDWTIALTSYDALGGKLWYMGADGKIEYSLVKEFYMKLIAMNEFLTIAGEQTGQNLMNENSPLSTNKIFQGAVANTNQEVLNIKDRITELKRLENSEMESVKEGTIKTKKVIREIMGINGDTNNWKEDIERIEIERNKIDLTDQKFSSDIKTLKGFSQRLVSINESAEKSYQEQLEKFNKMNPFSRFIKKIFGGIRRIFY